MKLENIITIINGYPFDSTDFNLLGDGRPVIKIKELKRGSVIFTKDTCYTKVRNLLKQFEIHEGDCLIALTGNPPNKGGFDAIVGRACIYKNKQIAYLNQRVCKVFSNSKILLNEYLFYYLSLNSTILNLASRCTGSANQANISSNDIKDLEIPLPGVAVQHHIVNIVRNQL